MNTLVRPLERKCNGKSVPRAPLPSTPRPPTPCTHDGGTSMGYVNIRLTVYVRVATTKGPTPPSSTYELNLCIVYQP